VKAKKNADNQHAFISQKIAGTVCDAHACSNKSNASSPKKRDLKEEKTFLLFFICFFNEFIKLLSSFLEVLDSLVKKLCKDEKIMSLKTFTNLER